MPDRQRRDALHVLVHLPAAGGEVGLARLPRRVLVEELVAPAPELPDGLRRAPELAVRDGLANLAEGLLDARLRRRRQHAVRHAAPEVLRVELQRARRVVAERV